MKRFELLPYGKKEDWFIAFVDVEATGLKPGYHEMVDIGVVLTDLDGNVQEDFFRRIQPVHPERASEEAVAMNGFSVERWRSFDASSPDQAVADTVRFYKESVGDRNVLFCAYNESFDYAFVDHLFRGTEYEFRDLHNYTLDLPSIAWGVGVPCLHNGKLVEHLDVSPEPQASNPDTDPWEHTGLTGAYLNVRLYRALLENGE